MKWLLCFVLFLGNQAYAGKACEDILVSSGESKSFWSVFSPRSIGQIARFARDPIAPEVWEKNVIQALENQPRAQAKILATFWQVLRDPEADVSEEQSELIGRFPVVKNGFEAVKILSRFNLGMNSFKEKLFFLMSGSHLSSVHFHRETGFMNKMGSLLGDIGHPIVNFFNPVSFLYRFQQPADGIFLKQWKDPSFVPSAEEQAFLQKYDLEKRFEKRGRFLAENTGWVGIRRWIEYSIHGLVVAGGIFSLNHLVQEKVVTMDSFVTEPAYSIGDDQVQVVTNLVRSFPHTSIRIGGDVYWYGVQDLTKVSAKEYFSTTESAHGTAYTRRTFKIVTLNLTKDSVAEMRRYLESNLGKNYQNETGSNDCATMTSRLIERFSDLRIPDFLEQSPSQLSMYLSSLKTLGSSDVADIYALTTSVDESLGEQWRDALIMAEESALASKLIFVLYPKRVYIDLTETQDSLHRDSFQWKARIAAFKQEAKNSLDEDVLLNVYWKKLEKIAQNVDIDKSEKMVRIQELENKVWHHLREKANVAVSRSSDDGADQYDMTKYGFEATLYYREYQKFSTRAAEILGN